MPGKSSSWAAKVGAMLAKDIRQEYRTRYAAGAILLFGVTTVTVVSFTMGRLDLPVEAQAAVLWIIIFFAAMSGLAQSFIREEETKTAVALRLYADPNPVYVGKLIYNILILALLVAVITPLYIIMTDMIVSGIGLFCLILFLGIIGLAGATTLIAAIISKANIRGALFAVLSFPLLLPLLIGAIGGTAKTLSENEDYWAAASSEIQLLISYAVVVITAGILLFEFVWEE